jgi:hypothetical protein
MEGRALGCLMVAVERGGFEGGAGDAAEGGAVVEGVGEAAVAFTRAFFLGGIVSGSQGAIKRG